MNKTKQITLRKKIFIIFCSILIMASLPLSVFAIDTDITQNGNTTTITHTLTDFSESLTFLSKGYITEIDFEPYGVGEPFLLTFGFPADSNYGIYTCLTNGNGLNTGLIPIYGANEVSYDVIFNTTLNNSAPIDGFYSQLWVFYFDESLNPLLTTSYDVYENNNLSDIHNTEIINTEYESYYNEQYTGQVKYISIVSGFFIYPEAFTQYEGTYSINIDSVSVTAETQYYNNNESEDNPMTVTTIITTILEAATGLLGGIGTGAVEFFESVFLNAEGTGLSSLGTYLLVFVGFGIAIGVMRWIRAKIG